VPTVIATGFAGLMAQVGAGLGEGTTGPNGVDNAAFGVLDVPGQLGDAVQVGSGDGNAGVGGDEVSRRPTVTSLMSTGCCSATQRTGDRFTTPVDGHQSRLSNPGHPPPTRNRYARRSVTLGCRYLRLAEASYSAAVPSR
jgi:hypothetical protein